MALQFETDMSNNDSMLNHMITRTEKNNLISSESILSKFRRLNNSGIVQTTMIKLKMVA